MGYGIWFKPRPRPAGDRRRELRNRASRVRRRISRMSALRQLLAGLLCRECHARGKCPADHGYPMRSADCVLAAFAARSRRRYAEHAEGATNPNDNIRKAGEAISALQPDALPYEGRFCTREAWHQVWARTCRGKRRSWKGGGAGIRWLPEGQVDALGTAVQR